MKESRYKDTNNNDATELTKNYIREQWGRLIYFFFYFNKHSVLNFCVLSKNNYIIVWWGKWFNRHCKIFTLWADISVNEISLDTS